MSAKSYLRSKLSALLRRPRLVRRARVLDAELRDLEAQIDLLRPRAIGTSEFISKPPASPRHLDLLISFAKSGSTPLAVIAEPLGSAGESLSRVDPTSVAVLDAELAQVQAEIDALNELAAS